MRKGNVAFIILGVIFLLFPLVIHSDYYQHLVIIALMWVVIGSSWNLLAGYTGQVSFGSAAFFGAGAYTAGLLVTKLGWSAWWGLPLGAIMTMLIAFPFGGICFRLRGAYFALGTLALTEVMRHIATIWESFTDGMVGIRVDEVETVGPDKVHLDFIPVTTRFCDLCAERTGNGEVPSCVKHCQANCMMYGPVTELVKAMEDKPRSLIFAPL